MEIVGGNEHVTERQVVEIGDVNFVVGFALGPYPTCVRLVCDSVTGLADRSISINLPYFQDAKRAPSAVEALVGT